jgi:DNA adenine methylase
MRNGLEKSNYLGSKRRLATYIAGKFPVDGGKGGGAIFDPMCGVSAVLIEAARRGYRVRGNDLSIVPYWYSKGVFEGAPLADADVEKLANAPPHEGWLTTEWQGEYPRPPAVRRQLDGLAKLARAWQGPKGLAAKAAVSAALQTLYSESGSGYSTRRYESPEKVRAVVRRAAKEVSRLAAEVGGRGAITNANALTMRFPQTDVVYFDPPYFKRDKGAVHYFQSYRIMNSILLGREWKQANLKPDDIPALLARLCKSARHIFVSTSSNEVVPYAKELARHKNRMKRFRVSYRQTSGFGSRDAEQHQNLFVAKAGAPASEITVPPEDGEYRYVIQEHFRGRTAHADLRMETGRGGLAGWTLGTQVAGSIAEPVTTVDAAREVSGHSKVDWQAGNVIEPVVAEPKGKCSASWLDFEGVIPAGDTGALAGHPGVVVIVDGGACEYGARREGYREYFLTSNRPAGGVTGRAVFTKLDGTKLDGTKPGGPREGTWLFSLPADDTPHVLSDRAVESGWVPPQGVSALPRSLKDDVPEEMRYWGHEGESARRRARDALVEALRDGRANDLERDGRSRGDGEFEKRKLTPFNQWGGSAKYAKRLVARLPEHKRYAEPFCGAAAVLFVKDRADEEVLGDLDPDVVFALKYIRGLTPAKFAELKRFNWKVSRAGFKRVRACEPKSDSERFWKFAYWRLCSWGGIPRSTGFSTLHAGQTYKLEDLWRFHERLKSVRIVRRDWLETLRECDGKGTLFFIDPPYVEEWGAGGKARGAAVPPEDIAAGVRSLKGSFVIAYTDSARARRALSKVGRLFKMRFLEARHRGLWSKRSRLFVASPEIRKDLERDSQDIKWLGTADLPSGAPPQEGGTGRFVLQRHSFDKHGDVPARHWDLRIDAGEETLRHWILDRDIARAGEATGCFARDLNKRALDAEGFYPPGSSVDPAGDAPSFVEIVDGGECRLLVDRPGLVKVAFDAGELRGVWLLNEQDSNWHVRRADQSSAAEPEEAMACSL